MAQAKKYSRIIIKPPVYHATQSPLYNDMRHVRIISSMFDRYSFALGPQVHCARTRHKELADCLVVGTQSVSVHIHRYLSLGSRNAPWRWSERAFAGHIGQFALFLRPPRTAVQSQRILQSDVHRAVPRELADGQAKVSAWVPRHHRTNITASPYVELKDISPAVMEMVLEFMYTYHVEWIPDEHLLDLLAASSLFLLLQLKKICVNQVIRMLTLENVFTHLYTADVFQASKLVSLFILRLIIFLSVWMLTIFIFFLLAWCVLRSDRTEYRKVV